MTKEQSLPEWAKNHFPMSAEKAKAWKGRTEIHSLDTCVLAVAHTRVEGTWCAYIGAVSGICHDDESAMVLKYGDKLGEEIALVLFPQFKGIPYSL